MKLDSYLKLFPPLNSFPSFRSRVKLVSTETIQGNTVSENSIEIFLLGKKRMLLLLIQILASLELKSERSKVCSSWPIPIYKKDFWLVSVHSFYIIHYVHRIYNRALHSADFGDKKNQCIWKAV